MSSPAMAARRRLPGIARAAPCILILAAVLTIYVVLGVLYESFIHSADHPLRLAGCCLRRAGGAEGDGHGLLDHRADRPADADRHRQEKRDHDDRFRGGTDARKGRAARNRHSRGLRAPFPADHDDDLLRAAWRLPHHARFGREFGTAPAARSGDGRRPAGQPGADPVHHPGDLPVVRPPEPALSGRSAAGVAVGGAGQ